MIGMPAFASAVGLVERVAFEVLRGVLGEPVDVERLLPARRAALALPLAAGPRADVEHRRIEVKCGGLAGMRGGEVHGVEPAAAEAFEHGALREAKRADGAPVKLIHERDGLRVAVHVAHFEKRDVPAGIRAARCRPAARGRRIPCARSTACPARRSRASRRGRDDRRGRNHVSRIRSTWWEAAHLRHWRRR